MPLYEYECADCGEQFEALVSASKKDESRKCPACGSEKTERMLSTFAVGNSSPSSEVPCPTCTTGTCGL